MRAYSKLSVLIHFCNSITLSRKELTFLAFLTVTSKHQNKMILKMCVSGISEANKSKLCHLEHVPALVGVVRSLSCQVWLGNLA